MANIVPKNLIKSKIYEVRGRKVMIDKDLAELYGVETRVLNQAVTRNEDRFPEDFMFRLRKKEFFNLRSQFVGCDTLIGLKDRIIGKPQSREQARKVLKMISGEKHRVLTAVALLSTPEKTE